ncbi:MAG: type I restriction endonuclease subunit R, partial [Opitutales bacterium]|nr:type I restriction endonuclease subunit R [Opitutales bacterium]
MSYDYSENILVQESAGNLLRDELRWEVVFAYNTEKLGENGTFGRRSYKEILLTRYFRKALRELNPWLTAAQEEEAVSVMLRRISTASLLQTNREKYGFVRDGVPVTVRLSDGRTEEKRARVIDFQKPEANHFLAVKEMKIHGNLHRRRTDIVGFVNGIPLLFVELKRPSVDVRNAYEDNYADYRDTIPQLFYYNAFLILSNGLKAKVGTLGSKYEFFHEWKRLSEQDAGCVELETMLRGICRKETFLDLLEHFILFDASGGNTVKILARNHQYLGVNEAVKAYATRKLNQGKLGVFWHTQGSGKSYSMIFFAQKIRRTFIGSPTIVVLTDRDELNTQISDTFESCGLLGSAKARQFIAASSRDLLVKLQGNPSFIFTLIQKFNRSDVAPICPNHDIVIMSDEAHRTQYGFFAANMCKLLPTASRIGFTGTPLLSSDNITERTFGGYVSVYDFKRAVEDGATVPLYYENRGEKLQDLKNPEITERILDAIENADLDVEQQERLEREFAKEIHLLTAEPRLDAIARDFVEHYSDLWTSGKAMFVCLNKVTCVRMYDLVQKYWRERMEKLRREIAGNTHQQEALELARKLHWMEETEMAVVVSQEQNEIRTFEKWGLDILSHREKMERRELDKEFKDAKNPFRIVFVCAMWLTGFDVKSLACLYLDKPLKAHTLMQTIARANRVSEGKSNGLIIDYVGIVKALRKALADYTGHIGRGGADPTIDKQSLLEKVEELVGKAETFLKERDFVLSDLIRARDFQKVAFLKDGADAACRSAEEKKTFHAYVSELGRLMRFVERRELSEKTLTRFEALEAIDRELRKPKFVADYEELKVRINQILNEYVDLERVSSGPVNSARESKNSAGYGLRRFDLSQIDFDLLAREFARKKQKNLLLRDIEEILQIRLAAMIKENPSRIDYYERYRALIDEYNQEQDRASIEKTFMELMKLSGELDAEQKRYLKEEFENEEELALYDLLFSENLSPKEIKQLKIVAVDLLKKVKSKIAELDHWTDKPETQAVVETLIRDILWEELPESYDEQS